MTELVKVSLNLNEVFEDRKTGEEVKLVGVRYESNDEKAYLTYEYKNEYQEELDSHDFHNKFTEKEKYKPVRAMDFYSIPKYSYVKATDFNHLYIKPSQAGEVKLTEVNVNQDILKLIEAGYEFSSFWGDTVDGRSINVDLNEEEAK